MKIHGDLMRPGGGNEESSTGTGRCVTAEDWILNLIKPDSTSPPALSGSSKTSNLTRNRSAGRGARGTRDSSTHQLLLERNAQTHLGGGCSAKSAADKTYGRQRWSTPTAPRASLLSSSLHFQASLPKLPR